MAKIQKFFKVCYN